MNTTLNNLYCYLLESRINKFLPSEYFGPTSSRLIQQESALRETCSDQQRELLEQFQKSIALSHDQEMQALFLATWTVARELL